MMDVLGSRQTSGCSGTTRRDFLRVGALGTTGLLLPDLLRARAATAAPKDTSVIWLFLSGGPTHFETFDPKPGNPLPYRSTVGTLKTNVPGTHIGGLFPRLARLADKYTLIRSFTHSQADHASATHWLSTGKDHPPAGNGAPAIQPSIGSVLAKHRGPSRSSGLPTYVRTDNLYADGPVWLGSGYAPFDARGSAISNMSPKVAVERLADRRSLLRAFDSIDRRIDQSGTMTAFDGFEGRAIDLVRGQARQAFDLSREPARLRERYGKGLGERLLLARRLAEAGSSFITVWHGGWDSHGTNPAVNHGTIEEEMHKHCPPLDHALPVLIEDLHARGLEKKVLVAVVGEFGRSPHINKSGGREHWPLLGNLLLSGGGLPMGRLVGESQTKGDIPKSDPVSPQDFLATLFQFLGMPLDLQFRDLTGRPVTLLDQGKPIAALS